MDTEITYNTYFGPTDARFKKIALEIERKFIQGETMPNKHVAVFNVNPEGQLVVRLVPVKPHELSFSSNQLTFRAQEGILLKVQDSLGGVGSPHKVVGISNVLPSEYGQGGAYVYPVTIRPRKEYEVVVGQRAKMIEDLTSDY